MSSDQVRPQLAQLAPIGGFYFGRIYTNVACAICGRPFSKCGMANHLRRHRKVALKKAEENRASRKSAAWWDGWKEGYLAGVQEAAMTVHPGSSECE